MDASTVYNSIQINYGTFEKVRFHFHEKSCTVVTGDIDSLVTTSSEENIVQMIMDDTITDVPEYIRERVVGFRTARADLELPGPWWDHKGKELFSSAIKCMIGASIDKYGSTHRVLVDTHSDERSPCYARVLTYTGDTTQEEPAVADVLTKAIHTVTSVVEIKSSKKPQGITQLYKSMIGLWTKDNHSMMGVYCINGQVSRPKLIKQVHFEKDSLCLSTSESVCLYSGCVLYEAVPLCFAGYLLVRLLLAYLLLSFTPGSNP